MKIMHMLMVYITESSTVGKCLNFLIVPKEGSVRVLIFRPLGHCFFIFCFADFFHNKLGSEDEIKMKFIQTIFQLN